MCIFPATQQQLESVWWTEDGCNLYSSHSDGSYCRWTMGEGDVNEEEEKSDIPYGEKQRWLHSRTFASPVARAPLKADDLSPYHCRPFSLQGHF